MCHSGLILDFSMTFLHVYFYVSLRHLGGNYIKNILRLKSLFYIQSFKKLMLEIRLNYTPSHPFYFVRFKPYRSGELLILSERGGGNMNNFRTYST